MNTPILITTFRRPLFLEQLLESLSGSSHPIYIWFDGPKDNRDRELISDSIKVIERFKDLRIVDVKLNDTHLSSADSIASAITWIFLRESCAIILEDDIIPTNLFLKNTSFLLEHYSTDFRVGSVLGSNYVPDRFISDTTSMYRTTKFVSSWGWATWADRWTLFAHELTNWGDYVGSLPTSVDSHFGRIKWKNIFQSIENGQFDSWDYRWQFTSWRNEWVHIAPNSNLVKNIGFTPEATHTFQKPGWFIDGVNRTKHPPQLLPTTLLVDSKADRWTARNIHASHNWYWIKTNLKKNYKKYFKN